MSPRTPEQNEEIRQTRNRQIIEAAKQVYTEKGFHGTEIGEVAKRAGIARGLVYYYYKDKLALFQALFEEALEQAVRSITGLLKTGEPPIERLRKYAGFYIHSTMERPEFFRFFRNLFGDILLVFGDRATEVQDTFVKGIHQPLVDTMQEGMDCGELKPGNAWIAAQMYWGGVSGSLDILHRLTDPEEKEAAVRQTMDALFSGILRNERKDPS